MGRRESDILSEIKSVLWDLFISCKWGVHLYCPALSQKAKHHTCEAVDVIRLCCHIAVLWQRQLNLCTPIPVLVFKLAHIQCPFLWVCRLLGNTSISYGCWCPMLSPRCRVTLLPSLWCPLSCLCLVPEPPLPALLKSASSLAFPSLPSCPRSDASASLPP